MKKIATTLRNAHWQALTGILLLAFVATGSPAWAKSDPFSHLVAFGTSLSDTGNYYRLSGGLPPPPYADGRFCNGPVWVEYLTENLGMAYQSADNFAVAGATTGTLNINNGAGKTYPGLQDEITAFLNGPPISEPQRALYVVEAGANDFFAALELGTSPATLIATGVGNTLTAVQRLRASGARFILVMNVPDLGVTPMARNMGPSGAAMVTQLCAAYNQALEMALNHLAQAGIPTLRLDSFAALDQMANDPAAYGFTDVTTPWLYSDYSLSPNQFLFWDPVHPTTGAHEVLARAAVQQLMDAFSPRNGQGNPDASTHALNGLVNASLHNARSY